MMLKSYKPLLLNDMFQLYLQQKHNINTSQFVYSFNLSYFLNEKEAARINCDYFEDIFSEVHLTEQEDGDYLLELFDLKKSILQEFDCDYEKKTLDKSYICILDFVNQQELLLNKNVSSGYTQVKKLNILVSNQHKPTLYMNQLIKKYSHLKRQHDIPFLILSTPYLKWTKTVEEKIIAYFGTYFQEIRLQYIRIDEFDYITAVQLSDLKIGVLCFQKGDLLNLIQ